MTFWQYLGWICLSWTYWKLYHKYAINCPCIPPKFSDHILSSNSFLIVEIHFYLGFSSFMETGKGTDVFTTS